MNLPEQVLLGAPERQFGVYVHVPYCRVRCGYCDFNTYTATELKGTTQTQYADEAISEMRYGSDLMQNSGLPTRQAETVFFGGGTPTLLPVEDLTKMLQGIKSTWGISSSAEVSIEANPDSVDKTYLEKLKEAGFTRLSFGMQSAVPHVLKVLDRTHNPKNVEKVVKWAKELELQTSVDLIYGTPGESLDDWRHSVETALSYGPGHISAYALIIEEGTKLAAQIRRGQVERPDDDLQADMYELVDAMLSANGFSWYELSNWSTSPQEVSRHNLAYWQNTDWWGVGPGAHSHIGGLRWWNVKHPAAYAERISLGMSPKLDSELLSSEAALLEEVMLQTRLAEGMPVSKLPTKRPEIIAGLIGDGLIDAKSALGDRIVLTLKGRLLADAVVHRLTEGF